MRVFLLVLFATLVSRSGAFAEPILAKVEILGVQTSIAATSDYCVQDVIPFPTYSFVENERGAKGYECAVDFTATLAEGARNFSLNGTRNIQYSFIPYVADRRYYNKTEYLKQHAPAGSIIYEIPDDVFQRFDISKPYQEKWITDGLRQMAPNAKNIERAAHAACFVAFLEILANACSLTSLGRIRQDLLTRAGAAGFLNPNQFENLGGVK